MSNDFEHNVNQEFSSANFNLEDRFLADLESKLDARAATSGDAFAKSFQEADFPINEAYQKGFEATLSTLHRRRLVKNAALYFLAFCALLLIIWPFTFSNNTGNNAQIETNCKQETEPSSTQNTGYISPVNKQESSNEIQHIIAAEDSIQITVNGLKGSVASIRKGNNPSKTSNTSSSLPASSPEKLSANNDLPAESNFPINGMSSKNALSPTQTILNNEKLFFSSQLDGESDSDFTYTAPKPLKINPLTPLSWEYQTNELTKMDSISNTNQTTELSENKKGGKWSMMIAGGAIMNLMPIPSSDADFQGISNSSSKGGISPAFHFGIQRSLTNRISLGAGISSSQISSTYEFDQVKVLFSTKQYTLWDTSETYYSSKEVVIDSTFFGGGTSGRWVYDTTITITNDTTRSYSEFIKDSLISDTTVQNNTGEISYNTVSVPIYLSYELINGAQWRLSLEGGIIYSYLTLKSSSMNAYLLEANKLPKSGFAFSGMIGTALERRLATQTWIYFRTGANFGLYNSIKTGNQTTKLLYLHGQLGLRYNF